MKRNFRMYAALLCAALVATLTIAVSAPEAQAVQPPSETILKTSSTSTFGKRVLPQQKNVYSNNGKYRVSGVSRFMMVTRISDNKRTMKEVDFNLGQPYWKEIYNTMWIGNDGTIYSRTPGKFNVVIHHKGASSEEVIHAAILQDEVSTWGTLARDKALPQVASFCTGLGAPCQVSALGSYLDGKPKAHVDQLVADNSSDDISNSGNETWSDLTQNDKQDITANAGNKGMGYLLGIIQEFKMTSADIEEMNKMLEDHQKNGTFITYRCKVECDSKKTSPGNGGGSDDNPDPDDNPPLPDDREYPIVTPIDPPPDIPREEVPPLN